MGRVTRTLRLLLAAAGLAHLAFSPPGRVRPAGGRRGKRLKQEPQSWSEVLTQMAPEESERGRSLPVAVAVRSWLRRIVIGDGLCPWAEDAVDSGALAVVCLVESDEQAVAARLLQHGDLLARAKPPGGRQATTLCLAPRCHELRRTRHFHKVCDFLDLHLDETKVQLAPFHPKWRFLDRRLPGEGERPPEGSDAADFVNRAPVPAFHFLRVSDVEGAAASHSPGDWEAASASVALRNAQLLRKRGAQSCAEEVSKRESSGSEQKGAKSTG
ncbi:unnamed protein product [Effrenium voratum]|uniref:Uncharacterized protein n=1 Tax=Effrenium voratum TaxID=2562239 RepID=A0AA36J8A8_9DINO|nr:unnamed protein product [Effrenium voratum]